MSEEVENKNEELIPIVGVLEEPMQLMAELNTIYSEPDKYSESHKQKKTIEWIQKISEKTGFSDPRISELTNKLSEKEQEFTKILTEKETNISELSSKLGENETLKSEKEESLKKISELSAELEKFRLGRNSKVYGEKEMLNGEYVDRKAEWIELLQTNPQEATRYYDKHINKLSKGK